MAKISKIEAQKRKGLDIIYTLMVSMLFRLRKCFDSVPFDEGNRAR